MNLKELEDELDVLIEIKEQSSWLDDEELDDEIDEVIGKLLASMSKQDRLVCEAMTQLNVYGHASTETLLDSFY